MRRIYPLGAQKLWEAEFDFVNDTFKIALLSATYVYDDAHEFYDDLTGVVATATITGKTNVEGLLDAADTAFVALTGAQVTQAVIYKDTGVPGTSPLALYVNEGNNLPFTPDGTDYNWIWDNGPNKIAKTS